MSEWPSSSVWVICFYGHWRATSVPSARIMVIMVSVTLVSWRSFSRCPPCYCLLRELTDRIQVYFGLAEPGQVSITSVHPRGVFLTDSSQYQHVTAVCHNYFNQKLKSISLFFFSSISITWKHSVSPFCEFSKTVSMFVLLSSVLLFEYLI